MSKKKPVKLSIATTVQPKLLLLDGLLVVAMWTFGVIASKRFFWIIPMKPSLINALLLAASLWFLLDLILILIQRCKSKKE